MKFSPKSSVSRRRRRTQGPARLAWPLYSLVLVLALLAGGRLANGWSEYRCSSTAGDFSNDLPYLDSFSTPSVAEAILEREMERAFSEYSNRNSNEAPEALNAISTIKQLQTNVARLKLELDRALLAIYASQQQTNQFLEQYLDFLREAPVYQLGAWTPHALEVAHQSGRIDELVEALQAEARFRPASRGEALQKRLFQLQELCPELADLIKPCL